MFYVYILHCSDGGLYTGFNKDLKRRISKYDKGYVRSTKYRRPIKLIYYECFINETDARCREKYLKGGGGKKTIEKLLSNYFKKYPWKK